MTLHRSIKATIGLAVAAAVTFTGAQAASAVSGSITGHTAPVSVTFTDSTTSGAALFTLETGDSDALLAYCIDLLTGTQTGVTYDEGTWGAADVPGVANVTAILQASFPVLTVAQLQMQVPGLTEQEAIAGTQAAIWHFTDSKDLAQTPDSNIVKLYNYLLETAIHPGTEPVPALSISPSTLSGTIGTRVGPYTLGINPSNATATVTSSDSGAVFTDAAGSTIVPDTDGEEFWVTPAATGTFRIDATASVAVPTGRVFLHPTSTGDPTARQKLVLAKSDDVTTSATASFSSEEIVPTTTNVPETTTTAPATTTVPETTTTVPETTATVPETTTTVPETTTTVPETTTTVPETTTTVPETTRTVQSAAIVPETTSTSTTTSAPVVPTTATATLPATGASTLPTLLLAIATLTLGIIITAATHRRGT